MMSSQQQRTTAGQQACVGGIGQHASLPTVNIPPGHVGEFVIPGSGKRVWWTGRVAIGLLHQPPRRSEAVSTSALWIQRLMLAGRGFAAAEHA